MNNITQLYKNSIKNFLKETITNLTDEFAEAIVNGLCVNNDNYDSYVNLMSSLQEGSRKLILETLTKCFEELDKKIRNDHNRLKKYVINKSNVPRTITTLFGDITFKRTYYTSRVTGESSFLLDETLGLPKYDRYDPMVKAETIKVYTKTNQKIAGEIVGDDINLIANKLVNNNHPIPRQSVYNWIKSWNKPKARINIPSTPGTLYIMIDEKFIGCQDLDKDIMIKSFVTFTGEVNISKNRKALQNRIVYNTAKSAPIAWKSFVDFIYDIYDSDKIKSIYVISDSGKWIKANTSELKMHPDMIIKRLNCEFHFRKYVNLITFDEDKRREIVNNFKTMNKKDFRSYVDNYEIQSTERKDKIHQSIEYIFNNYTEIKDMLNFNLGSSMEAHISHILAKPFGSRPKGYFSTNIEKYLSINDDVCNGINIYDAYLRTYNALPDTINDSNDEIHNDKNNHNASINEYYKTTNLPLLNSSFSSPLEYTLTEISSLKNDIQFI